MSDMREVRKSMRWCAATLALLGTPWALIAWLLIAGGVGAVVEEWSAGRVWDAAAVLIFWPLFSAHVVVGYMIWFRWIMIATGKRQGSRTFWWIAAGHHAIWLALFSAMASGPFLAYLTALTVTCVLVASLAERPEKRRNRDADEVNPTGETPVPRNS